MNEITKLIVKEDAEGELYIELPYEMMNILKWNDYDELTWIIEEDGRILLRKREKDDPSNET